MSYVILTYKDNNNVIYKKIRQKPGEEIISIFKDPVVNYGENTAQVTVLRPVSSIPERAPSNNAEYIVECDTFTVSPITGAIVYVYNNNINNASQITDQQLLVGTTIPFYTEPFKYDTFMIHPTLDSVSGGYTVSFIILGLSYTVGQTQIFNVFMPIYSDSTRTVKIGELPFIIKVIHTSSASTGD
jgi:hypothetical protein